MLIKTRGIVLSYLKYRETSIIARIYTERLGVQSYVVNGVRKAKPPGRIALFQPFTLLELVAYVARGSGGLTRLSEFRCAEPFLTPALRGAEKQRGAVSVGSGGPGRARGRAERAAVSVSARFHSGF